MVIAAVLMIAGPLARYASDTDAQARNWRAPPEDLEQFAPFPVDHPDAVVQAYCARAYSWRGAFADHCWIAAKPKNAYQYRRYEVIGWRLRRDGSAIVVSNTSEPDRHWFGAAPVLHQDIRGAAAEEIIEQLPSAVSSYPYARTYRVWPGPNSNTFIAHLGREIPELALALPGTAIGKDYLGPALMASAPSGTGFQVSLGGVFGIMLAAREGLEVNILGLVIGADPLNLALTVPGVGRIPGRPLNQQIETQ